MWAPVGTPLFLTLHSDFTFCVAPSPKLLNLLQTKQFFSLFAQPYRGRPIMPDMSIRLFLIRVCGPCSNRSGPDNEKKERVSFLYFHCVSLGTQKPQGAGS